MKANESFVEHYGHAAFFRLHNCPVCENSWECKPVCRLESTIECLPCLQRQLLEDIERFSNEAREFLKTALPTDDLTLIWWRALRQEIDGKLKGLGTRAEELLKRLSLGEL